MKIVSRRVDSSREVKLLRLCQGHPNIVQLHEVHHDEVGWNAAALPQNDRKRG